MTALEAIPGLPELWDRTLGEPDVTIGVVEGPPDLTHPCFAGADLTVLSPSWLPATTPDPLAEEHGTFVASMLFGQHDGPVPGLAPGCRGIIVPALRDQATVLDPLNAARAIDTLVDAGCHIIHFTAAHPTRSGDADSVLKNAVRHAFEAGVLIVAPTGNDYGHHDVVPGILPQVLAVGAHRDDGTMFEYSNWGPRFRDHGIVAPGGDLRAAAPGGRATTHKGTSIATPIVSGVAALLTSLQRQQGGKPDPLAVRAALLGSARPCAPEHSHGDPERCLAGRLDIPSATRTVLSTGVVTSAAHPRTPVYALGALGYDFCTEARRDTFAHLMATEPHDPRAMAAHLTHRPTDAKAVTWILDLDGIPLYALEPVGAYAPRVYHALTRLLGEQDSLERISVPGRLTGSTARLLSGQVLPVVELETPRNLTGWQIHQITEQALPGQNTERARTTLRELLSRIYHDLRNPGTTARDRALNFAATTAFHTTTLIATAAEGLALDTIGADRTPHCRTASDCWDVTFRFFDPDNNRRARTVHRFTVDVSDLTPVTVGEPRTWLATPANPRKEP
ncbi:S8 family serine peptidase [Amycolatopsis lurida]